jgi:signal peptidase I
MLGRILLVVVLTVGILAGVFFGLTKRYTVPTRAMEPTVAKGDHVVVFTPPASAANQCGVSGSQVERVIGLPGETVSEQTGRVLIDGKPLNEPYVKPANRDSQTAAWHVPAGSYFLMGDNRARSCDSRKFGSVAKQAIVGRVVLTYWPVDRISAG